MTNFYSIKKTTSPYKVTSTKKASAYSAYSGGNKQNNVYSNSIGIFDKEYVVIPTVPSSVQGDESASIPVVIPFVPVTTAPSEVPSAVPEETVETVDTAAPVTTTQTVEEKKTTSKKKNGIIIALAVLAAAAILFIPSKKHK